MKWSNRKIAGIKIRELLLYFFFYLALSLFYYIILMLNRYGQLKEEEDIWGVEMWFGFGGLQYIIMFFATGIVWLVIFKLFRKWQLWKRFLLHLIGLPFFILMAQQLYYSICDQIGYGHLEGSGQVWDVYIPTLIYLIQFSIFHAYEYYVLNQRKKQAELELRHSILKNELSALKAQLNPHFLYNVFNTINASVPAEMEDTREMIAELADLFRYQLKASQEDLVTLNDEIDFVKQYLKLEKRRFEDRLKVEFDIPAELLSEKIPPMIIQPIVENSVKHGISPIVEGGSIRISANRSSGKLKLTISDTGIGIENKKDIFKKGIGLGNTQQLLKKLYGAEIELSDNDPSGLIVSFNL